MKNKILFLLFFLPYSLFSQTETLSLGSNVWPPFTNLGGEKAIASDIVTEALKRAGYIAQDTILDFKDVLAGLKDESIDGSPAIWKNEEREEFLLFSEPFLVNQLILVGRKGSDVSAKSLSDLSDKKIAIVAGFAYGESLQANETVSFVSGKDQQEGLDRLLADSVDYMLVDEFLIEFLLQNQSADVVQYLEIGSNIMIQRELHFGLNKSHPNALQIMDKFNEQINKMVLDGTYHRILKLNWIQLDVDNDGSLELVLEGDKAGTVEPPRAYSIMFQDAYTPVPETSLRYYIDGNFYNDWNSIPRKYKRPVNTSIGFTVLRFSL